MFPMLLDSVRVLDLSQYIPGPFAAQLLADLGADVIKIEPPAGDPMRRFGPPDENGFSPLYSLVNRNKRILTIDLKTDAGKEELARLVSKTDILLESYRPGVLERLGFGRERLEELNPGLVHCAISGFGQSGPWRLAAGHDINYMALAGGLEGSGEVDRPALAFPPVADHATAITAAFAICAALFQRERQLRRNPGRKPAGRYIDIGLSDAICAWQTAGMTAAARGAGHVFHDWLLPRGKGLLNGGIACYRLYPCKGGGSMAVGALEEKFWIAFCTAVGRTDWIERQYEAAPQTALISEMEALFLTKTREDWQQTLENVDCCVSPVEPLEIMADHPQLAARGIINRFGEGAEKMVEALFPALIDGNPASSRREMVLTETSSVLSSWISQE